MHQKPSEKVERGYSALRHHVSVFVSGVLTLGLFLGLGIVAAVQAQAQELCMDSLKAQTAQMLETSEQSVEPMASSGSARIVGNELITPDYRLTLPDYWLKNAELKIDYSRYDSDDTYNYADCVIWDRQSEPIFYISSTYTPNFKPYPLADGTLAFSKKVGNCYIYGWWVAFVYYIPSYPHGTNKNDLASRIMDLNSGGAERYTAGEWDAMDGDARYAVAKRCTDWLKGALSNVSLPFEDVPVSGDPSVSFVYRLVNPYTNKHFFTTDATEANSLQAQGWYYENIGWHAPASSGRPIYRLYNPYTAEHLYTTSKNEYDTLVARGWTGENIKLYSAGNSGTPTYRLYNPWAPGASAHHYTTDKTEYDTLISQGWKDEGVCWYGL